MNDMSNMDIHHLLTKWTQNVGESDNAAVNNEVLVKNILGPQATLKDADAQKNNITMQKIHTIVCQVLGTQQEELGKKDLPALKILQKAAAHLPQLKLDWNYWDPWSGLPPPPLLNTEIQHSIAEIEKIIPRYNSEVTEVLPGFADIALDYLPPEDQVKIGREVAKMNEGDIHEIANAIIALYNENPKDPTIPQMISGFFLEASLAQQDIFLEKFYTSINNVPEKNALFSYLIDFLPQKMTLLRLTKMAPLIEDKHINIIIKRLINLMHLDLTDCKKITSLRIIANGPPKLKELILKNCEGIRSRTLEELIASPTTKLEGLILPNGVDFGEYVENLRNEEARKQQALEEKKD